MNKEEEQYLKYGGFCGECGNELPPYSPAMNKPTQDTKREPEWTLKDMETDGKIITAVHINDVRYVPEKPLSDTKTLDEQITDIITETLDFYYGNQSKHRLWRPHGIAVSKVKALITQEQIKELKAMPNHTAVNLYVRNRITELEATLKEQDNG